jgi:hypothetical protein
MWKNIGKFYVTPDAVEHDNFPNALAKIKFVPLRVEFIYHKLVFEYIGYSEMFLDNNKKDFPPPEYNLSIHENSDNGQIDVSVNLAG